MASNINHNNNTKDQIDEFNNKKSTIENIYKTYVDEKDLINKLSSQKLIDKKTDIKKNINFTNPLLSEYATICDLKRNVDDINNQIIKWKQDIVDLNKKSLINKSDKETNDNEISLINDKIKQKQNELNQKKTQILKSEQDSKTRLSTLMKDVNDTNKNIEDYENNKSKK